MNSEFLRPPLGIHCEVPQEGRVSSAHTALIHVERKLDGLILEKKTQVWGNHNLDEQTRKSLLNYIEWLRLGVLFSSPSDQSTQRHCVREKEVISQQLHSLPQHQRPFFEEVLLLEQRLEDLMSKKRALETSLRQNLLTEMPQPLVVWRK